MSATGLSIGEVARRTGIPVTTLRFYEKELPGLFPTRKTSGGHRRYQDRDVARFATVRALTEEGLPLSELRQALMSRGDHEAVREAVDRLGQMQTEVARDVADLSRRVAELEARLSVQEAGRRPGGWFGKRSGRSRLE